MERADVISLLGRLKQAYPQAYAKMTRTEAEELVSLWVGHAGRGRSCCGKGRSGRADCRGHEGISLPKVGPSAGKDQGRSFPTRLGGVDEAIHRADSRTGILPAKRFSLCERTRADVGSGGCRNGRRCAVSGYRGGIFKCPFYSRDYRDYLNCEGRPSQTAERRAGRIYAALLRQRRMATLPIARALTLHYERTENR